MESVKSAQNILVVYDQNDLVNPLIEDLKQKTSGVITTKLISELPGEGSAVYDFIISGYANQHGLNHDDNLLSRFLKVLKPNGIIVLRQVVSSQNQILSKLKLTGFTKVAENRMVNVSDEELGVLKQKLNVEGDVSVVEVSCAKPNFEVGSSAKLSFASKKVDTASVWKINSNLDDDDDAIDPDTLLDDDDLKKPDPTSLRVCGTTGKRKACKDCSCGLADELAIEANGGVAPAPAPKSSCGSCYLGDAFRCATCPYLGMPAFKPGEKIQLAGNQLQADI